MIRMDWVFDTCFYAVGLIWLNFGFLLCFWVGVFGLMVQVGGSGGWFGLACFGWLSIVLLT